MSRREHAARQTLARLRAELPLHAAERGMSSLWQDARGELAQWAHRLPDLAQAASPAIAPPSARTAVKLPWPRVPDPGRWHRRAAVLLDQITALESHLHHRAIQRALPVIVPGAPIRTARRLNRAAGMLALSVLLDSAMEHYRGSFKNRAMYTPLVVSSVTLGFSAHGLIDRRADVHRLRHASYAAAALTGLAGSGFHLFNVLKRPGGFAWQNLFYGAPLGAPAAILLAGALGAAAERLRNQESEAAPRLLSLPAGRLLAGLSGLGILGTSAEAALLHFRGAFQNPGMFIPVTVPPIAAGLLARVALIPRRARYGFTRQWLRLTACVGIAGVGFHAWGVQRMMGGWRNWRQNAVDGPPLPAPPAFTGLALAGLAALGLMRENPDA